MRFIAPFDRVEFHGNGLRIVIVETIVNPVGIVVLVEPRVLVPVFVIVTEYVTS